MPEWKDVLAWQHVTAAESIKLVLVEGLEQLTAVSCEPVTLAALRHVNLSSFSDVCVIGEH